MRAAARCLLLVLLAAPCGCAGADLLDVGRHAVQQSEKTRVLVPAWKHTLVEDNQKTYRPWEGSTLAGDPKTGRIWVGTSTGWFHSLRSADGKRIWSLDTGEAIHSVPTLGEDRATIYFGNEAGGLLALDATTGGEIWRYEATAEIRCKPLVHQDIVLVRDVRGKVHAVDGRSGEGLWLYRGDAPEGYLVASNAGVALASGYVIAGFATGVATGIRLLDGSKEWEADLGEFSPGTTDHDTQKPDANTTPVVLDADHVLVTSYNGGLFALDPRSGSIQWRRSDLLRISGLEVHDGTVYVARASVGVTALDSAGESLWTSKFPSGTLSTPVVSGQRLYLSDSKYGLIVVSRADGRVLDRFTPAYGATTSPLVKAGRAFLLTNGGHVYSFRLTPPAGS